MVYTTGYVGGYSATTTTTAGYDLAADTLVTVNSFGYDTVTCDSAGWRVSGPSQIQSKPKSPTKDIKSIISYFYNR